MGRDNGIDRLWFYDWVSLMTKKWIPLFQLVELRTDTSWGHITECAGHQNISNRLLNVLSPKLNSKPNPRCSWQYLVTLLPWFSAYNMCTSHRTCCHHATCHQGMLSETLGLESAAAWCWEGQCFHRANNSALIETQGSNYRKSDF